MDPPRLYSASSDIFSLGLALIEMYIGCLYVKRHPFTKGSILGDYLNMLRGGYIPTISACRNDIEKDVQSVISGCLKYDPESRLSAWEARRKLQNILSVISSDKPDIKLNISTDIQIQSAAETVASMITSTLGGDSLNISYGPNSETEMSL